MKDFIDMRDRTVLVAGASSGIGQKTAIELSKLGAKVILLARRENKLLETLEMLSGIGHSYYVIDLSDSSKIEPMVKRVIAEQGKLDGMVYAAGIGLSQPLMQTSYKKCKSVFAVNYFGFVELTRQVCKRGRFQEGMRIVAVSSTAAFCGDKTKLVYSGSKAAIDASVRCIAKEMADKRICINSVAPAMTEIAMYEGYIKARGESSVSEKYLLSRQYLGIGKTEDIASAIIYLLSPTARFVTGTTLAVDGGYTSC